MKFENQPMRRNVFRQSWKPQPTSNFCLSFKLAKRRFKFVINRSFFTNSYTSFTFIFIQIVFEAVLNPFAVNEQHCIEWFYVNPMVPEI